MIKRIAGLVLICLFISAGYAQTGYTVEKDPLNQNETMLVGVIQKEDITKNPEYLKWYDDSRKIYKKANADAVEALKKNKDKLYFMIFGGTWCPDTHYVLPKFFKIQEEAGFPEDHIALFALDHNKKMQYPVAEAMDVHSVPTIVVLKDGKEVGRVVEYGETGYWDKELAEIINKAFDPQHATSN